MGKKGVFYVYHAAIVEDSPADAQHLHRLLEQYGAQNDSVINMVKPYKQKYPRRNCFRRGYHFNL